MAKVKWDEGKIEKFVSDGWSLSYDKANDRFKLQKRVKDKVKSYSLPKQFNEFCWKLKEELKLTKGKPLKEIFKTIEDEKTRLVDLDLSWDKVEKVLEKYCKEKAKNLTPEDVARMALYSYLILKKSGGARVDETLLFAEAHEDMIQELEDEINAISRSLRNYFGQKEIPIWCPKCKQWSYLKYGDVEIRIDSKVLRKWKDWICSKCGEIPF